ncbi:hypothetical protein FNF31_04802 [Cafeteria roenbergensis]|uniref:Uncharacterized protein n=1 Tax=Cafeteria roenbergensis TaxID=33653 RepID=A0A5A8D2A5_CAFRO|nr:hypothetical protein FNF31_04802 [Cafeteria roenbergensis]
MESAHAVSGVAALPLLLVALGLLAAVLIWRLPYVTPVRRSAAHALLCAVGLAMSAGVLSPWPAWPPSSRDGTASQSEAGSQLAVPLGSHPLPGKAAAPAEGLEWLCAAQSFGISFFRAALAAWLGLGLGLFSAVSSDVRLRMAGGAIFRRSRIIAYAVAALVSLPTLAARTAPLGVWCDIAQPSWMGLLMVTLPQVAAAMLGVVSLAAAAAASCQRRAEYDEMRASTLATGESFLTGVARGRIDKDARLAKPTTLHGAASSSTVRLPGEPASTSVPETRLGSSGAPLGEISSTAGEAKFELKIESSVTPTQRESLAQFPLGAAMDPRLASNRP